jgi:putative ABC transport system permease protein
MRRIGRPGKRRDIVLEPSRMSARLLVAESVAGLLQRPGRSALTALGTILGVGTLVAILGLTATASSQVDSRFNALLNTQVIVQDVGPDQVDEGPSFPQDATERIDQLHGVESAGLYWKVRLGSGDTVLSSPLAAPPVTVPTVEAVTPDFLTTAGGHLQQGRLLTPWDASSNQAVTVLGSGVARELGITTLSTQPAVFIGDRAFTVVGIVDDSERVADLLSWVMIPTTSATAYWGAPDDPGVAMLIVTAAGAAPQIAAEAPPALRPDHPDYFKSIAPPDPRTLRTAVTGDLARLSLLLALVSLVIGTVGIANTSLVAVLERTSEIGLRRALGALRRHVTAQFVAEAGILGALGGLVGTTGGLVAVLMVSFHLGWTPAMQPVLLLAAPGIGLLTGTIAGIYPAWKASRIQPAVALRR